MKADVGMLYPVAAAIDEYTPGTSITYADGFVVSEARGATINFETEDGEFYGDDVLLDVANSIVGYSIDFETTGIKNSVKNKLVGLVNTSGNNYRITGAPSPDVGFGFIRRMHDDSSGSVVETFEAWWLYKVRFAMPNEEGHTKEKNLEWSSPTLNGKGMGIYLTEGADHPDFIEVEEFDSLTDAKEFLNDKAGISSGTSSSGTSGSGTSSGTGGN